jgi:hypothetical protein
VKLRKEEANKVKTGCTLVFISPDGIANGNQLDQQLRHVLDEANKKFMSYTDKKTVILIRGI